MRKNQRRWKSSLKAAGELPAALFKIKAGGEKSLEREKKIIRKFRYPDRKRVAEIFIDNAFSGLQVQKIFPRFGFLAWAMMGRYFIFRRDLFWVAEDSRGRVVGFICGDTDGFLLNLAKFVLLFPVVLFQFLVDAIFITRQGWVFLYRFFRSTIRGEFGFSRKGILLEFPAHLHINIERDLRQEGLGSELMEVFLKDLDRKGIKGLHLRLYDVEEGGRVYRFFRKFGFEEAFRKKISFFSAEEGEKMYLITMVRKMGGG